MDRDARTLYCGNLSNRTTEDVLYELFLQAGPIEEVKIPKDRDSRSRGYGFVTYKHDESVDYAMELFKGTTLYNRELTIDKKLRMPVEQPTNQHQGMFMPLSIGNYGGMPIAKMPQIIFPQGPSAFPNPYGSHIQLGYQGPANMYPSNDRRNSSRQHPYYRH